ncbi:phage tail protein [Mucilaginibacter ginsenosidivorax]|uniref:Phage tail protein n=1 Tax=Mucilaginibacter ginsenosidivorax TaxID=862126 RepID=A0A5B8W9T8_9SPHI|nr:tail fiber protein [Mucilaginibacter ginsenosidivorax]QEC79662.1 phage tail protein [Mucilaginibacter ginsenosidivorax]
MEPYIGEIRMFAGNFAPQGWFFCDGSLLSISQYSAFFSLLGTTYGGDGMSTFQIPDLRGRAPIHSGNGQGKNVSRYELGQVGGNENITLIAPQMPAHSHVINCSSTADLAVPAAGYPAASSDPALGTIINSYASTTDSQMNPLAVAPAGGNQPVNVVTPYLAVNFIIAWQGIWPSRP